MLSKDLLLDLGGTIYFGPSLLFFKSQSVLFLNDSDFYLVRA